MPTRSHRQRGSDVEPRPVGRWVAVTTGRTLDQHAADPVSAAARLPRTASSLRRARTELLLTIDRLRTALINEDDLTGGTAAAVTGPLAAICEWGRAYTDARSEADTLIADPVRTEYARTNCDRSLRRRHVNPGDTVLIVLPHTGACRKQQLAGRRIRVRVGGSDAELDLPVGPGQLRLPHADAGVYHDLAHGTLYVLEPPGDEPAAAGD